MARIGLVLGAGGATGGAFHAGVLSALAEGAGWDPRTAEIVVGTSAGSATGAVLRAGLPAVDFAARAQGTPLSAEGAQLLAAAGPTPVAFPPRPPRRSGRLRPASPRAFVQWPPRRGMIAAALPAGAVPTDIISEGLGPLFGDSWPERPLWLCAVRLRDGARVVFGREGGPPANVGEAVAASCAIPAWFQPVEIDGERYVDGGAHSPTNLDLVAGLGLDLVVVSSPMSSAGRGVRLAPDAMARQLFRNYLDREAMRVRRRGTPVIAFQPTAADQAVMGGNPMDAGKRGPVVSQVKESTLRRLDRPDVRARLTPLEDHGA